MKRFILVALGLVAASCSSGVSGAQTYNVDVDQASPEGKKFQFSAYYPASVTAAPGDSIVFTNASTEAPHTISFGVEADRSNSPPVVTPQGENPAVFGPCYTAEAPTPELVACPDTELPDYAGEGYWNSGVLQPVPAPEAAGAKNVTVKLASDIAEGSYTYVCILHSLMAGTIEVNEDDRISTDEVIKAGDEAAGAGLDSSAEIEDPAVVREGNTVTVSAGFGDRVVSVNRFAPADVEVPTGTTVQWVARSPYEPHTVTFESPFETPNDEGALAPGGVASGAAYTGGFSSSGILGPEGGPFPSGPFALRFTNAGTFEYSCVLHPGQVGKVTVT
jgi:plastocyanin